MDRKYLRRSPHRVAKLARTIAKLIDFAIIFGLAILFYPLGILLASLYVVMSDSLQNGQSVGKRIMGLRVISLEDGRPCTIKQSIIRNLPLLIPLIVAIIPIWGIFLAAILLIPLTGLELYLIYSLDSGLRLGDVMADTTVMGNDPQVEISIREKKESWFEDSKQAPSANCASHKSLS